MATILIVDDSNFSRRLLRRILETEGHRVIESSDGFAALEQYALARPDAAIIDLTMPGMSGLELLAALRDMSPPARVLVATADIQHSVRQQVLDTGAGFVQKPFVAEEVLSHLNRLLTGETLQR